MYARLGELGGNWGQSQTAKDNQARGQSQQKITSAVKITKPIIRARIIQGGQKTDGKPNVSGYQHSLSRSRPNLLGAEGRVGEGSSRK